MYRSEIKDLLENNGGNGIKVIVKIPVCVYYESKNGYSESECEDLNIGGLLSLDNIDDSYGLSILEEGDGYIVNIPSETTCILKRGSNANYDCQVIYKNIRSDLCFDEDEYTIDDYFEIEE